MRPLNFDKIVYRRDIEPRMPEMTPTERVEYERHKNDWIYVYAKMLQIKDRDIKIQKIKDKILKNTVLFIDK